LTTVEINYEFLGYKASELILSYINGEEMEIDIDIPIKLIKRESVKLLT
jgi:DNA-binding LacI/PurR family transcriptional regulator